jgi:glycosyltransferase involved in cell wall biosynthesis
MFAPLVSIVTPVLNGARFLREMIESVRAQDYPAIEHIVLDGGSTDGTVELLQQTTGIVWRTGRDAGMYDAVNQGFRLSRGEIVAYLNSDDRYVVPDGVSTAIRRFAEEPDVDVVYGDFRFIDTDGRYASVRQPRGRRFDVAALRHGNYIPAHSTFVRKSVVEGGHWFDPTLQFAGDWDWVLGMAQAGKKFSHVDRVLSEFRLHGAAKTATFGWRRKLSEWRIICRRRGASLPLLFAYEVGATAKFAAQKCIRRLGMGA